MVAEVKLAVFVHVLFEELETLIDYFLNVYYLVIGAETFGRLYAL